MDGLFLLNEFQGIDKNHYSNGISQEVRTDCKPPHAQKYNESQGNVENVINKEPSQKNGVNKTTNKIEKKIVVVNRFAYYH